MKTSICYAHAKFRGNPSVFGQTPPKLHMTKNIAIFRNSRPRTKTKIPPLNLPSKTESDRHQFCLKRPTSKVDLV